MHIFLKELRDILDKHYHIEVFNLSPFQTVSNIGLLQSYSDKIEPDTLYLCNLKNLMELDKDLSFPLLCPITGPSGPNTRLLGKRSVIFVYDADINDILLTLNRYMYTLGSRSSVLLDFSRRLILCKNLKELLEEGYKILQNPIVITYSNQRIFMNTDPDLVNNPIYEKIIECEYCPIGHDGLENIRENLEEYAHTDTVLSREKGYMPNVICKEIKSGNHLHGFLHIYQFSKEFSDEDIYIAEMLSNAICLKLPADFHKKAQFQHTYTLYDLCIDVLKGDLSNKEEVLKRVEKSNIVLKSQFQIIVSQDKNAGYSDIPVPLNKIANDIAADIGEAIGFVYRNAIVLLINTDIDLWENESKFEERLSHVSNKYHQIFGISDIFFSLERLQDFLHQSVSAIELGTKLHFGKSVYLYKDYVVYHAVELAVSQEWQGNFCAPEIIRLIQYSGGSDSALIQTLKAYLKCGCVKSETSRVTGIPLNTIKYRLAKIEQITHLHLDDENVALRLLVSFRVIEYTEKVLHIMEPD